MKNKWKSISSVVVIGIFVVIAAASFGPDTSTNTTVAISNCKSKPAFTGQLQVSVTVVDEDSEPIEATGSLFIVHQKVRPDTTCSYDVVLNTIEDFTVALDDIYTYDGPNFIHDNSEDLFRVQLAINGSAEHGRYDEVKVVKYSEQSIQFHAVVHKYNNL